MSSYFAPEARGEDACVTMRFARVSVDDHVGFGVLEADNFKEFRTYRDQPSDFQLFVSDARKNGLSLDLWSEKLLKAGPTESYHLPNLEAAAACTEPALLSPIMPGQVWAAGFTYPTPPGWNKYAAERSAKRPILFLKGTGINCVGPNDFIGVRADSTCTIPEPELALLLDSDGTILGYTIANDVTAVDFTNTSPLYISYSKTYERSLALGPVVVTPSSLPDPAHLDIRIGVLRNGVVIAGGNSNTSQLLFSFQDLISYTLEHNKLAACTILCTGGGVWLPFNFTLHPDDIVEIEIAHIGILRNVAQKV
jgi:2-dehydro-3-deoxy-D-arabinonate dehydratase